MLHFRHPTLDDLDQLKALHDSLFPVQYSLSTIRNFISNRSFYSLLAVTQKEGNEVIIGCITSKVIETSFCGLIKEACIFLSSKFLDICTFGVHKKYQRKGIASALMNVSLFIVHRL